MSEELKGRTKQFAVDVLRLCAEVPPSSLSRNLVHQLIRSSSSVAANYRSACRAKSTPDFLAKLAIVEEEADESEFWLELLHELKVQQLVHLPANSWDALQRLRNEASQLVAIAVSSKKTARKRMQSSSPR